MGYYVKVEVNVHLYVEDILPGGRPILFVHGWPLNHNLFEYQFDELPKMGYRCIGIDQRGFGSSDKPASGYSYDRMADDLRGVVNSLNLQNFTLVGHSVGGAIAVRYMARHSGYGVSKLVLVGAAAPSFTIRDDFPYGHMPEEVDALIQKIYDDRPAMLWEIGDQFFFQYITEPLAQWFFGMGLEAAGWSTVAVLQSLRSETLFSDLEKIAVPTMICHGFHDRICPYPLGEAQHKRIRNSKLVTFENSGHGLVIEQKAKFNYELINFI